MSTLVVSALFTQGGGAPATGLALANVTMYLRSRNRSTGVVAVIWAGVPATGEIGGGLYAKDYTSADETTYDYYAWAIYTGAVALDSNYSLQSAPLTQSLNLCDVWSCANRYLSDTPACSGGCTHSVWGH